MNRGLGLALLAIVGGAIGAFAIVIAVGGGLLGLLWLFVFGDNPWPTWAETFLNLAIPIAGLLLWAIIGWRIWSQLRSRNGPPEAG
ncbi:MAG: hypothetical protein ABI422_06375 [Sphingomicrobium sp.]